MTFSIVARDAKTGALGAATATGGPVVGALVPHVRAGVGAIATQGMTNPFYGPDGLDLLGGGARAADALARVKAEDGDAERRQCIVVDAAGGTAMWTGAACIPYAGALSAPGVAVAGNMLAGPDVLVAMLRAFESSEVSFEDRLLLALREANAAGGDVRGVRSAALTVFTDQPYPSVDIRADWSQTPIADLATILAAIREPSYADFFAEVPRRQSP